MNHFTLAELAQTTSLDRSTLSRTRNGRTMPHQRNGVAIVNGLATLCRSRLGIRVVDPHTALVTFVERSRAD